MVIYQSVNSALVNVNIRIEKKRNLRERKRITIYVNYRLSKNTRRKNHKALNGKLKSSSTRENLGIDIDLYKKWIEYQMTPDINWSNIEIHHVKPICLFDVSEDEEIKEAFNWKNTQPLLNQDHQLKRIKFKFLDYQLQFIEAYQYLKVNEDGLIKIFIEKCTLIHLEETIYLISYYVIILMNYGVLI